MSVEKIGRNDLCFCGSGNKYKFCCINKAAQPLQGPNEPFAPVSEALVLRTLLAQSRPFRAFYDAERSKLGAIYWMDTLPMPVGIDAQAIRLLNADTPTIYLRHIPAVLSKALIIAHELMHLILDAEGFPFIVTRSERQPLAALLNGVVQDPLIGARLRHYGFDLDKKIERDIKSTLASLQNARPPLDRVARMMWVLNYAGQLLEYKTASEGTRAQVQIFTRWFGEHHPAIAAEGEELVTTVQDSAYDTPERMRAFFERITQRYQLADDFIIS